MKEELDQYHRDMMSEEAKTEEDLVMAIEVLAYLVVIFAALLVLGLGVMILRG